MGPWSDDVSVEFSSMSYCMYVGDPWVLGASVTALYTQRWSVMFVLVSDLRHEAPCSSSDPKTQIVQQSACDPSSISPWRVCHLWRAPHLHWSAGRIWDKFHPFVLWTNLVQCLVALSTQSICWYPTWHRFAAKTVITETWSIAPCGQPQNKIWLFVAELILAMNDSVCNMDQARSFVFMDDILMLTG